MYGLILNLLRFATHPAALSLHFIPFGSLNSDYPENPLQEFSQIGYANFG